MFHYDWASVPREPLNEKLTRQVIHTERSTIARLTIRAGGLVPVHHHENEQVSMVVSGKLKFLLGDREVIVERGQWIVLQPGEPHGVEILEDSDVIDLFVPRREDWIRGEDAYLRR